MQTRSETALSLMRMALALLDRDSEVLAACHLQHAIEIAEQNAVPGFADPIGCRAEHSSH